jgi:hypothetical protein
MLTAMRSVVAALLLTLVACAPTNKQPQTAANAAGQGSGSGVVCHEVNDTGTMFTHTECTPVEDEKNQQDDAQRWMKRPRSSPTAAH